MCGAGGNLGRWIWWMLDERPLALAHQIGPRIAAARRKEEGRREGGKEGANARRLKPCATPFAHSPRWVGRWRGGEPKRLHAPLLPHQSGEWKRGAKGFSKRVYTATDKKAPKLTPLAGKSPGSSRLGKRFFKACIWAGLGWPHSTSALPPFPAIPPLTVAPCNQFHWGSLR